MIQQDYLMRLIHQAIQVVIRIVSKKNSALYDDATEDIETSLSQYFGLRLNELRKLSTAELRELIREHQLEEPQLLAVLAELLKLDGEITMEKGQFEKGQSILHRSLSIFLMSVEKETEVLPISTLNKLEETIQITRHWPKDTELICLLISYLEKQGRYAEAEDYLFAGFEVNSKGPEYAPDGREDGSETADRDKQLIGFGISFYHRLLEKDDQQLENGNLPRHEVNDGITELEERLESSRKNRGKQRGS